MAEAAGKYLLAAALGALITASGMWPKMSVLETRLDEQSRRLDRIEMATQSTNEKLSSIQTDITRFAVGARER